MKQLGVQDKITISKDEDDEASAIVIRVSKERQIGLLGIEEEVRAFCALKGYSVKRVAADEWLAVDRKGINTVGAVLPGEQLKQVYFPKDVIAKTLRRLLDTLCLNKIDTHLVVDRLNLNAHGKNEIQVTERIGNGHPPLDREPHPEGFLPLH